jgi:mRNA interferase HicA
MDCVRLATLRTRKPQRFLGITGCCNAHRCVYTVPVKRRDLEQKMTELGWRFLRRGGRHDVWTDGEREEPVPRHREINETLARAILRPIQKETR